MYHPLTPSSLFPSRQTIPSTNFPRFFFSYPLLLPNYLLFISPLQLFFPPVPSSLLQDRLPSSNVLPFFLISTLPLQDHCLPFFISFSTAFCFLLHPPFPLKLTLFLLFFISFPCFLHLSFIPSWHTFFLFTCYCFLSPLPFPFLFKPNFNLPPFISFLHYLYYSFMTDFPSFSILSFFLHPSPTLPSCTPLMEYPHQAITTQRINTALRHASNFAGHILLSKVNTEQSGGRPALELRVYIQKRQVNKDTSRYIHRTRKLPGKFIKRPRTPLPQPV